LSKSTLKIKDIFPFLHSEILDFVEFVSPTPENNKKRECVVDRVRGVLLKSYPDAKVCVFGSFASA
jgi:non-canonical poly(A) RNA polymerase PAPD5/7